MEEKKLLNKVVEASGAELSVEDLILLYSLLHKQELESSRQDLRHAILLNMNENDEALRLTKKLAEIEVDSQLRLARELRKIDDKLSFRYGFDGV